ncbi:hypothetical protein SAMN05428960_1822 [Mitsuaria sp. PDC51]|uniref:WD40/YVTN/BNR-like repeat-containing protein n=1 Tax=unclassified Roseateles TaxID=2626991 RepID=UPI0008F131C4|nr:MULTISPECIES: hypothetical protein [unclassified Roseateles]MBB3281121.1 hypothetical protein [Mitsuaria sp. BK037]SFR79635.1 hypothetical protein SAMN05428960_1822 [Mitsuaria sp. PDC51]
MLRIEDYKAYFEGFGIRDAVLRDRNILVFIALQDWDDAKPRPFEEELKTRYICYFRDEDRWGADHLEGFAGLMAGASLKPLFQNVCVDRSGQVYVKGSGASETERKIPGGMGQGPKRGSVRNIKQLNGWLFGCGSPRSLFKRTGREHWEEVGPLPPEGRGETGFQDFDGFSESDIYAAGGKGDVWRYDGTAWHKIAFPSNMWIESVCCGEDGYVYIGAQSGTVYRGRGDQWMMIHQGDLSLPFRDMVWFKDRVYATNDYGLWEIHEGRLQPSQAPIEITNCAGNLSVADGVMLMAGAYGAALHDGQSWSRLFSIAELARQAQGG